MLCFFLVLRSCSNPVLLMLIKNLGIWDSNNQELLTQETNFYPWQSCASRRREIQKTVIWIWRQHFKTLKVLIAVYSQFGILGYLVGCHSRLWYTYMQTITGVVYLFVGVWGLLFGFFSPFFCVFSLFGWGFLFVFCLVWIVLVFVFFSLCK